MGRDARHIGICIDRALPAERLVEVADRAIAERSSNAPLQSAAATEPRLQRFRMAIETKKAWKPGRRLRVRFLDGDSYLSARIMDVASEWMEHANVELKHVDAGAAEIRVSLVTAGYWSVVGMDSTGVPKNEPTMALGGLTQHSTDDELRRVVLHEFGHALACVHEHQSPAADIPWDRDAVYAFYAGYPNFWTKQDVDINVLDAYSRTRTQFSDFDPESIMVYPVSPDLTAGRFQVDWNSDLSATDRRFIGLRYPKKAAGVLEIQPNSGTIEADIGAAGEEDQYSFTVDRPGEFVVETSGPTDLAMGLYGPDRLTRLIDENEGGGLGGNARVGTVLMKGRYLVRIRHQRPTGTGPYGLSVATATESQTT